MQPDPQEKKAVFTGALRRDIELFRGEDNPDGSPAWVIFDPVSDKYYKISELNYRIAALLDKSQELEGFVERVKRNGLEADKLTVLKLISFLHQSNLLMATYGVTDQKVEKFREMKRKMLGTRILSSYLFFRIPVFNPDRFLTATIDIVRTIFNRWTFILLWTIAAMGYIAVIMNWDKLADALLKSINLQGVVRYSLAVIIIKLIHEFAHAYTARALNIRVRRMGVAFIVFFPRLYTDLTDAWRLANRRQRFMMDAAGICSEIIIGGGAALVWANTQPGLSNSIAYYIFAVSIINTILINGNPFIRYDGYYLLMDITGIDNLQRRGITLIQEAIRKCLFGIEPQSTEQASVLKKTFMIAYGISAFIYRFFLYTSIILIVYYQFTRVVGIVLLFLEVHLLVLKPLTNEIKIIMHKRSQIKRRNFLISISGVVFILLILTVPLPWNISMPCEVKSADSSFVYARNSGFLEKIDVADGQQVKRGQVLFQQTNPFLEWNYVQAGIDLSLNSAELDRMESSNATLGRTDVKLQELEAARNKLKELERQKLLLVSRADVNGIFVLFDRHLKTGKWLNKGYVIGEVFNPAVKQVYAFIDESDVERVEAGDNVSVTLEGEMGTIRGKIVAVNSVPAFLTPSPLMQSFGGPIACFPPEDGIFRPVKPCYQVIVELPADCSMPIGRTGTVWLRKYSSVGGSLLRKVIHVLLRELSF